MVKLCGNWIRKDSPENRGHETLIIPIIYHKKTFKALVVAALLINSFCLAILAKANNAQKLYLRNTLYSTVLDDEQIPNETALNQEIARTSREDNENLNAYSVFTAAQQKNLRDILNRSKSLKCMGKGENPRTVLTELDCLARLLAADVSPYMMGGKCGLDGSLKSRIGQIIRGQGCCSDYNDAFIMRAKAIGLKAREVNNLGHTTAEYFDSQQGRWKWIDTSLRTQISDPKGRLLSAYEHSRRFPWQTLTLVDLPPFDKNRDDSKRFNGYLDANNAVLYWTQGNNLMEQDRFELPLAKLGLPKEIIQLTSLSLGVRPGWLVLAPREAAFRFRLSAFMLKSGIGLLMLTNGLLLFAALGWGLKTLNSRNKLLQGSQTAKPQKLEGEQLVGY